MHKTVGRWTSQESGYARAVRCLGLGRIDLGANSGGHIAELACSRPLTDRGLRERSTFLEASARSVGQRALLAAIRGGCNVKAKLVTSIVNY